jgi:hypothetical protein
MSTLTLSANSYFYIDFDTQSGFLGTLPTIRYYVESEYPINTFFVDDANLPLFLNGSQYTFYEMFNNMIEHRIVFNVPHIGNWHLIISNPNNRNTAVHYRDNW